MALLVILRSALGGHPAGLQKKATSEQSSMRPATLLSPLILTVCGAGLGMALAGCHKETPIQAPPQSSRGLKVEAYDAPIPKAPLQGGKLETMSERPAMEEPAAPEPAPVSSSPPLVDIHPDDKPQARIESQPDPRPDAYARQDSGGRA